MTYEKLTGAVNLEEIEVLADEVTEIAAAGFSLNIMGPSCTVELW